MVHWQVRCGSWCLFLRFNFNRNYGHNLIKILIQGFHSSWKVLEFENLDSKPGIFVEVLESPGIWTYRSIFLIISIQEFSRYISSEMWVNLCVLKVCEFIEMFLEFDIGRSWNLRCQNVYEPCKYAGVVIAQPVKNYGQVLFSVQDISYLMDHVQIVMFTHPMFV